MLRWLVRALVATFRRTRYIEIARTDAETARKGYAALRSDWEAVGRDMRTVMQGRKRN